jgi:heme-degrading monooxygenase HmoA
MAVQVFIKRKIVKEKIKEVAKLMVELRSLARAQPGYMSSESLQCIDPPGDEEYLIRSTWRSEKDWRRWLHSAERKTIQQKIDDITREKTEYNVYEALVGGIFPAY